MPPHLSDMSFFYSISCASHFSILITLNYLHAMKNSDLVLVISMRLAYCDVPITNEE